MNKTSILILSIIFLSCQRSGHDNTNSINSELNSDSTEVSKVKKKPDLSQQDTTDNFHYLLIATVEAPPQNIQEVSVPIGGIVKQVHILPGASVKKNELLAILEHPDYLELKANYLKARNELELYKKNYQRVVDLWNSKSAGNKEKDEAENAWKQSEIQVNELKEKLKLLHIQPEQLHSESLTAEIRLYAPFDGYVTEVLKNQGSYLKADEPLLECINSRDLHLTFYLPEKWAGKIKPGDKITAFPPYHTEKKYLCEVILVNRKLSSNHTLLIHCHFLENFEHLLPGMTLNVELDKIATPDENNSKS